LTFNLSNSMEYQAMQLDDTVITSPIKELHSPINDILQSMNDYSSAMNQVQLYSSETLPLSRFNEFIQRNIFKFEMNQLAIELSNAIEKQSITKTEQSYTQLKIVNACLSFRNPIVIVAACQYFIRLLKVNKLRMTPLIKRLLNAIQSKLFLLSKTKNRSVETVIHACMRVCYSTTKCQ